MQAHHQDQWHHPENIHHSNHNHQNSNHNHQNSHHNHQNIHHHNHLNSSRAHHHRNTPDPNLRHWPQLTPIKKTKLREAGLSDQQIKRGFWPTDRGVVVPKSLVEPTNRYLGLDAITRARSYHLFNPRAIFTGATALAFHGVRYLGGEQPTAFYTSGNSRSTPYSTVRPPPDHEPWLVAQSANGKLQHIPQCNPDPDFPKLAVVEGHLALGQAITSLERGGVQVNPEAWSVPVEVLRLPNMPNATLIRQVQLADCTLGILDDGAGEDRWVRYKKLQDTRLVKRIFRMADPGCQTPPESLLRLVVGSALGGVGAGAGGVLGGRGISGAGAGGARGGRGISGAGAGGARGGRGVGGVGAGAGGVLGGRGAAVGGGHGVGAGTGAGRIEVFERALPWRYLTQVAVYQQRRLITTLDGLLIHPLHPRFATVLADRRLILGLDQQEWVPHRQEDVLVGVQYDGQHHLDRVQRDKDAQIDLLLDEWGLPVRRVTFPMFREPERLLNFVFSPIIG